MMLLCGQCKEPAVRRVTRSDRDGQGITSHYCYVHAVEAGMIAFPVDSLKALAGERGYPLGACMFIVEALTRSGHISESLATEGPAVLATGTALDLCRSISRAGIERFAHEAGPVLSHWKLGRGKDIGAVLLELVRAGALAMPESCSSSVLNDLSVMEEPLDAADTAPA